LDEVKGNLSASIDKIRDCITSNAWDEIQLDSLKDKLERLVQKYNGSQGIKIKLAYRISPYLVDNISPEKAAQIYYIVQEAVTNVTKHSQADHAEILLEGRHDNIYVTIRDNGRGFSQHDIPLEGHFGIRSMQERTRRVNGLLHIEKLIKGTRVEVKIPC
jgi:signal transduction histidine kinase